MEGVPSSRSVEPRHSDPARGLSRDGAAETQPTPRRAESQIPGLYRGEPCRAVAGRMGGMQAVIDTRLLMSSQSSGSLIRSELD